MAETVIFHIDVNSAFLSWEAVYRLRELGEPEDLRLIPSAVGGDVESRHGIVVAKSVPAKKYGVQTGEPIGQAKRKCPDLVIAPPDHALYQRYSKAFMDILRQYSPTVEKFSVDEAFVDMTGMQALFGTPYEAADKIRTQIREELGFTVNVGISDNRVLAKMASDFEKPDKIHTLYTYEIETKLWPLPVGDLFMVGKSTERRLKAMGIRTIGDLANTDVKILEAALKKHGKTLHDFANGTSKATFDRAQVTEKSIGNSTTVPYDISDRDEAKHVLLRLTDKVAKRLRKAQMRAGVVMVQIRYADFTQTTHQGVLTDPTDVSADLYTQVCRLFDESWDGEGLRLLGVTAAHLTDKHEARQMSLFDTKDREKQQKLDAAMDQIRERFGDWSVGRASMIEKPLSDPKKPK